MLNTIVTGGSRGLGLAIARKLATVGHRVIAIARNTSEQLESAIQEAERRQLGLLQFRPFDLSDIQEIPDLIKGLRKEFGPIYGLVNNAALGSSGILAMMNDAQIGRTIRLNTISPIILTKYVVRSMIAGGKGRIVNIASIVGFTGYSGLSVYAASKASIIGFTRSLARELGPLGINVNAVAPGFVETEMTQGLEGQQHAQIVRRSALRRLVDADDIANSVEFLLGERARNVTGTVLTVDAGSTA
jgi:3-oxoacyl-[acyl-carrier protein] reductase